MHNQKLNKLALMCAASVLAMTAAARAQQTNDVEKVTVTGSRVISDISLSPTPLTVVTAEQLSATTPTDIPDALNKLPDFIGGSTPRSQNNQSVNNSGNTLNLRALGASRTLILLDGKRVAPSNQNGTTDVDILPQMLMSRVDVVTGGASAVYGSDAVAGVVNFILDKNFDGFKYEMNGGISKYGDAGSFKAGLAWGTDLFGGRGHFEMSARIYQQDMIPISARPYGYQDNTWVLSGSGTVAAPFVNVPKGRLFNQSQTGTINCGSAVTNSSGVITTPACSLTNYTFNPAGATIVPMTHGVPTTTSGLESGGDGGYEDNIGTYQSRQRQGEFFSRFSYDLTKDINGYVEAEWAESADYSTWAPLVVSSAASRPNSFFTNNPYLPAAVQTQFANATNVQTIKPVALNAAGTNAAQVGAAGLPYFSDASYVPQVIQGRNAAASSDVYVTKGLDRNLGLVAGLTGKLSNFNWDVSFSHQESRVETNDPNNTNNARYMAAEDAVIAPGTIGSGTTKIPQLGSTTGALTDVSGTIQCWSAIQPAYASLYAGCIPINVFNPAQGISQAAFDYIKRDTQWALTQQLDNISGSISGSLFGWGLPAGEITGALSAEMRWRTYDMKTNALPTDFVDCTGLRMCTVNGGSSPALWTQNVNAPVSVADNVWETALEFNVPLLKDMPLAQDLSLDLAGRYTYYSISGEAKTWKVGVNDRINDTVRLRGTMSLDIRAPNLNDLYQPTGISSTGFNDLLTTKNDSTQLVTKGFAGLTPEVAHTYTLGVVLTPDFIPGLTTSLDYYRTHMSNAINGTSYQSTTVQNLCLNSAPTYNSPYCLLATRPIAPGQPGYTSTSNYPTQIFSQPQNSAKVQTEGWNFEADYNFEWSDVWSVIPGSTTLRQLVTYQPVLETQSLPGTPYSWATQPKTRMTTFLNYQVGDWGFNLQDQWLSGWKKNSGVPATSNQVYAAPRVTSYNSLDMTINRRFDFLGGSSNMYFSVQNVGNTRAPLIPTNASNPGLFYPTSGLYSDVGRYFTIGLKGNL